MREDLEAVKKVFPTHVGVFLREDREKRHQGRLPHARGGVSSVVRACTVNSVSSPRTWGCFRIEEDLEAVKKVFPTHVGVFHYTFC